MALKNVIKAQAKTFYITYNAQKRVEHYKEAKLE